MTKKKLFLNSKSNSIFRRPEDPWWNPDDEEDYRKAYNNDIDKEEPPAPVINESMVNAFVNEYQPECDERIPQVQAISIGELREKLHIYRTFDDKSPDPLPYYLEVLANHGFKTIISFGGEMSILASRRNNGRGLQVEGVTEI